MERLCLVIVRANYPLIFLMLKPTAYSIFGRSLLVLINIVALLGCLNLAVLVLKKSKILGAVVVRPICSPAMLIMLTLCAVNLSIMRLFWLRVKQRNRRH